MGGKWQDYSEQGQKIPKTCQILVKLHFLHHYPRQLNFPESSTTTTSTRNTLEKSNITFWIEKDPAFLAFLQESYEFVSMA